MRFRRLWMVGCLAGLAVFATAPSAFSAPPANDTIEGATVIASVEFPGFFTQQDTTSATSDAVDAALNASCGAAATEASVWFKITAPSDSGLTVNVSNSFYSARVIVAKGTPGNLSFVACSDPSSVKSLIFPTQADETYYLLAFDDVPGDGNGGLLDIFVAEAVPAPEVTVTIGTDGTFDPATGTATVNGTYTCSGRGLGNAAVFGRLTQHESGYEVTARFQTSLLREPLPCDGVTHVWSATAEPEDVHLKGEGRNGFRGGLASGHVFAEDCSRDACSDDTDDKVVYLHSVGEASFPHEPPPNDTVQGAVSIPTFPGADYADTTYASTEPIDDALNAGCGAPATEASVWFALPGLTFEPVLIDTTASSYSTTILLATGTPDALTLVACGHGTLTVPFPARAWVAVVDDVPGGTNGGSLVLAIGDPNAPSINLSVDSVGGFDAATGVATLRGTTTCSGIGVADDLFGTARQDRGRPSAVEGGFRSFTPIPCDGLPHRWSHEVFPNPGDKFTGGPAKVSVVEFACFDYFVCRATRVDRTVYLRS